MSSGDTVLYENLMQHAEHYARLLNASAPPPQQSQQNANQPGYQNGRDEYDDEGGYGQSESGEETSAVNGRSAEPAMNGSDRGMDYSDAEQPPTPEVWNGIEQPIPDHQPNGEQQAAPSRRRRRSRYQRNQDQGGDEGAESASGEDSSATRVNGHAREAETERSAAPEFAGGNDTAAPDMQEPPHRNESSDS